MIRIWSFSVFMLCCLLAVSVVAARSAADRDPASVTPIHVPFFNGKV